MAFLDYPKRPRKAFAHSEIAPNVPDRPGIQIAENRRIGQTRKTIDDMVERPVSPRHQYRVKGFSFPFQKRQIPLQIAQSVNLKEGKDAAKPSAYRLNLGLGQGMSGGGGEDKEGFAFHIFILFKRVRPIKRGPDKPFEEGVGAHGPGGELGMKLAGEEERMPLQLDYLDQSRLRIDAAYPQITFLE